MGESQEECVCTKPCQQYTAPGHHEDIVKFYYCLRTVTVELFNVVTHDTSFLLVILDRWIIQLHYTTIEV